MAIMISSHQVYQALLPWFGATFLSQVDIIDSTAHLLRTHPSYQQNFSALYQKIDTHLFMELYHYSQGTMKITVEGKVFRVHTSSFPAIVDDLMGLYFFALPPTAVFFEQIKQYSLTTDSLNALKALYLLYGSFQSEKELATIKRFIQSIYPPWRYQSWIENDLPSSHKE
ncbi:MAG: hypothetical protein GX786_02015 [Clostridiales bacterium]|nr:hypothetical protein [Clostridiales bacterium]